MRVVVVVVVVAVFVARGSADVRGNGKEARTPRWVGREHGRGKSRTHGEARKEASVLDSKRKIIQIYVQKYM